MKKNILVSSMVLGLVLGLLGISSISNAAVATVSAGADQSITLPTSTVTLTGVATASSGSAIASYSWTQTSGPVASVVATPTASSTSVTGLTTAGSYVFTLTVSDNTSPTALTGSDTVTVTVNPAITNPVVNAGTDQNITSPTSGATLIGSATAAVGKSIASYLWTQTSGPTATIASSTSASTVVTGLTVVGSYVFTLTATDNSSPALSGSDSVIVTVGSPTPLPPIKAIKSRLEINPNGKVNLQGELMSIGTGTLSVKVWGITFTVNTLSAQWNGKVADVSGYKVGDIISVTGKIDTSASTPTIIARNVKDMTAQVVKDQQARILKATLRAQEAKNKENHGKEGKGNGQGQDN